MRKKIGHLIKDAVLIGAVVKELVNVCVEKQGEEDENIGNRENAEKKDLKKEDLKKEDLKKEDDKSITVIMIICQLICIYIYNMPIVAQVESKRCLYCKGSGLIKKSPFVCIDCKKHNLSSCIYCENANKSHYRECEKCYSTGKDNYQNRK